MVGALTSSVYITARKRLNMGPTTGRTAIELAFVALLITVLATRNSAAVNCKLRSGSPCICDLDDGSGYLDMTPLSKPSGGPS